MNHLEFRLLREALLFSAQTLADWMGVNVRTVQRWESGQESLPETRAKQLLSLNEEFERVCSQQAERIKAMVEEFSLEPGAKIRIPVYMTDRDYKSVAWEGSAWPNAGIHRHSIYRILQRLNSNHVELVPFNPKAYSEWLNGRKDTTARRSEWATQTSS